jgi:hypothetical protein
MNTTDQVFSNMVNSILSGKDRIPESVRNARGVVYRDGVASGQKAEKAEKPSKLDLAMRIVEEITDRKEAIEAIQIECDLQFNSAVTYFYNAKKKLAGL